MSQISNDLKSCIFFGDIEERMGLIPALMVVQFIYTTVVWAVIIGQKPGSSMTQLFTFFLSLFGIVMMVMFGKSNNEGDEDGKKTYLKALPWVAIFWLLHSVTTLICIFIHAVDKVFVDNLAGYIVMLIFCITFTCCWLQIALAFNYYSKIESGEEGRTQSVMHQRPSVAGGRPAGGGGEIQLGSSLAPQQPPPAMAQTRGGYGGMSAEEQAANLAVQGMTEEELMRHIQQQQYPQSQMQAMNQFANRQGQRT